MDVDDTVEDVDQPSTSKKKETQKKHSSEDTKDSSRGDQKTNSKTSMSNQSSYSGKSQNSGDSGLNMPKAASKSKENKERSELHREDREKDDKNDRTKANEKTRTRKYLLGRAEKHKAARRQRIRRAPKRRPRTRAERKKRDLSVSTIFTRLSSGFRTPGCKYCGHRCCRRRYEYRRAKRQGRRNRRKINKYGTRNKIVKNTPVHASVANQAGSRCDMLSPLFIKTNSELTEQEPSGNQYEEISPEMIYQALRRLTMWRQEVETEAILSYIKWQYPVHRDDELLSVELAEKLRIAAMVGIITRWGEGWALPTALQKRTLTKTHVTLFWQAYADTMSPFTINSREKDPKPQKKEDKSTE